MQVRSVTDWTNWQTRKCTEILIKLRSLTSSQDFEGHIPKIKPIILMSIDDGSSGQDNTWPPSIVKDRNVVAVHTLQYHKISRRADSTDYHREMRDVFSQRPLGFYESNITEIKKPMMHAEIEADKPAARDIPEPLRGRILSIATETVTSRLLLIIDMEAWQVRSSNPILPIHLKLKSYFGDYQDSRFNEKTARRTVESVLVEIYFNLGRLGYQVDRRLILISLKKAEEKVVRILEDMEGVQVVAPGNAIENLRLGVVCAYHLSTRRRGIWT